ncbi:MAG: pentapeptide repeat-containing protein [Oscillospiraceae bacterium]|nr:pentapeptide repeat-containing protein [Oscillospiraceae bacterium]
MEFAHKTVTDYFTAVKLYEDYFETALEQDDPVRALWEGFWRAFRYKPMPYDIMGYLAQIIQNRHKEDFDTYHRKFFDCYDEGVKAQTIWQVLDAPEYVCKMEYSQLPQQVGLVFRNLTYLLRYLGYKRFEKEPKKAYTDGISTFFQRGVEMDVWCYCWKGLRGADLRGADLYYADLRGVDLRGADLRGAYLHGADLSGVWLWDTDLPQLDEAIEKCGIRLVNPLVYRKETGDLLNYNHETNRAEEPEQT